MSTASDRVTVLEREGLRFDVRDEGPLDGVPVVLLHGFPQRASSWERVAPLLHEAGLRTLAPDQRGYAEGARPRGRRAYAVDRLVEDLSALATQVGRPVHVVGHDWGAVVGWAAAQRPDLVRTLTAVSVPHPAAFLGAMTTSDQVLRSWYVAFFQLPVLPEVVLGSPLGRRALRLSGMGTRARERFQEEMVDDGALPGALGWYRAIPFSGRGNRASVRVPTTFVWSDGDTAVSSAAALRCERHVDAPYSFVELSGVSHWIPDEAPGELAAAIIDRIASAGP